MAAQSSSLEVRTCSMPEVVSFGWNDGKEMWEIVEEAEDLPSFPKVIAPKTMSSLVVGAIVLD